MLLPEDVLVKEELDQLRDAPPEQLEVFRAPAAGDYQAGRGGGLAGRAEDAVNVELRKRGGTGGKNRCSRRMSGG